MRSLKKYTKSLSFFYLGCLIFGHAPAEARQDIVPGSRFTSGRAAAMGDAYLPIAEGGTEGLFYNPAALARKKNDAQLELVNLQFYGNNNYFSFINRDFYKVTSLSSYKANLENHSGQLVGVGASFAPAFTMRGFALGMLVNTQLSGMASDGQVRTKSLYQIIPAAGTGVALAGGIVRLGYSLQWVNQASGDVSVASDADPMGYNQGLAKGSALSHNMGFALTLPYRFLPAVNVVARNVLTAKFSESAIMPLAKNTSGVPANEPTSVDASFSIQPKLGRGSYVNMVAQYRDLTNTSGVPVTGRMALGFEMSVRDQVFLRAGWGSGYPSFGFGFRRKSAQLSVTYHSEDVGSFYHELKDTRYVFHYQIGIF